MNLGILGTAAVIGGAAYGLLKALWKLDHAICTPMYEDISREVANRVKQYRDAHPNEIFTDDRIRQLHDRYYKETLLELRRHQDETFKNRFRRKR